MARLHGNPGGWANPVAHSDVCLDRIIERIQEDGDREKRVEAATRRAIVGERGNDRRNVELVDEGDRLTKFEQAAEGSPKDAIARQSDQSNLGA